MTVEKRLCFFKFKTTDFQTDCLPFPKSVIKAIDNHMPDIAINRNEKLQETMRVNLELILTLFDPYFLYILKEKCDTRK
jgi:hypothetical protein